MEIDIQEVLRSMRDQIGQQAQEIAVLKATIEFLQNQQIASSEKTLEN